MLQKRTGENGLFDIATLLDELLMVFNRSLLKQKFKWFST